MGNAKKVESIRESIEKAKADIQTAEPEAETPEIEEIDSPEPDAPESEQISEENDQLDEAVEPVTQPDDAQVSEPSADGESYQPPASWSAESKADWSKAPKSIQRDAARRELELRQALTRATQEKSRFMEGYGQVAEILSPFESELRARNLTPAYMVQEMIKDKTFEDTDPQGYILQKMHQYGIHPQQFLQQQNNNSLPPELQGALAPLRQELAQVRTIRQQMEQAEVRKQMAAIEENNRAIGSTIEEFGSKHMNNGLLQDPDFIQELVDQASFLHGKFPNKSPSEKLEAAYDRALKVSEKGRSYLAQQEKAKQAQAQKAKIAAAKNAGSSISGNASDLVVQPKIGSTVRDAINASLKKQRGTR
jgi:hypothetical protein